MREASSNCIVALKLLEPHYSSEFLKYNSVSKQDLVFIYQPVGLLRLKMSKQFHFVLLKMNRELWNADTAVKNLHKSNH